MDNLILAQRELGDWIEMIIVLVVIAGSVLGGLSKKLIEKFSPDKTQLPGPARPDRRTAGAPPGRGVPPVRPVAKPVAPRLQPQQPPVRPVVQGQPPRVERGVAGAAGLEPTTTGFGDQSSTN